MAYTTDQLTVLEAAISSGVLTVRYADRTITYQSLSEMRSLRAEMQRELQGSSTTIKPFVRIASSKGMC